MPSIGAVDSGGGPVTVYTVIGGGITVTSGPPPTGGGIKVADVGALYNFGNLVAWVYDPTRGVFFVETKDGTIDSFDPIRQVASTLLNLDVATRGLAITPDGQSLLVGETAVVADPAGGGVMDGVMDKISLADLSVQKLTFTAASQEQGPYTIAVGSTGLGFFTTGFSGSGFTALRTFSASGAFAPAVVAADSSLSSTGYGPFLTLSEDGRYVVVADQDTSYGVISLVNAQTGAVLATTDQFTLGTNGGSLNKVDVNGHAGLVVEVNFAHVMVLDTALHLVKDLSSLQAGGDIIGVHFNQDGSRLYLWSESAKALLVYDTATWVEIGTIPVQANITGIVANNDATGQMSLGDNGRMLFLNTGAGFETIDLKSGWHASDFSGDAVSDVLIQNAAGAVVLGQVASGQVTYQQVAALGPEWHFLGSGDFLHYGVSDYLIESAAGALVVGDISGGQTTFSQVGAIGPEWTVEGVGHFQWGFDVGFVMESTSGALVLGQVTNGQATYSQVGGLGQEWSFRETGDFLGHGVSDVLIQNAAGAVVVGEMAAGQMTYTQVAALGSEWHFVGAGNVLGDGRTDFLIENAAGAVVAGEVVNGQAVYTQVAALGSEWTFVGVGDYLGEGHDQFLIESSTGAVVVGDYTGGQVHYTPVTALGSEWHFHP
jgi:hypothetical protein